MTKDFLAMENKDIPLSVGQKVQVVKKLEIKEDEIKKFCADKNMSAKAKDDYLKATKESIDKINNKIKEGLTGLIVSSIMSDLFVVRFEEEDDCFQFSVDEVNLEKRQFLIFSKENLLPLDEDSRLTGLALAIFQKKQGQTQNFLQEIRDLDYRINEFNVNLVNLRDNFNRYIRDLNLSKDKKKSIMAKMSENEFDTGLLEKQLAKIEKNEKVDRIELFEYNNHKYLIVRTAVLQYASPRVAYSQGYFTFVFGMDDNSIKVYGSKYYGSYCNPCVGSSGDVCFGSDTEKYKQMLRGGEIIPLILAMIPFLEEPDYASPHQQDYNTFFSQELKPNNEFDYDVLPNYVTKIGILNNIIGSNFNQVQFELDIEKRAGKKVERLRHGGATSRRIEADVEEAEDE